MAKRPEIKVEDFAAALDLTPTAVIPFEPQLFGTAANNGQMIAEADPKSPIAGIVRPGRAHRDRARRSHAARSAARSAPLLARFRGKKSA